MITNEILANYNGSGGSEITLPLNANQIGDGSVSNTEFSYLAGVEASIQGQLDACAKVGPYTLTSSYFVQADGYGALVDTGASWHNTYGIRQVGVSARYGTIGAGGTHFFYSGTGAGGIRARDLVVSASLGVAPSALLHAQGTGDQGLFAYDGENRTRVYTDVNGYFNIVPSGGRLYVNPTTYISQSAGAISDYTSTENVRLSISSGRLFIFQIASTQVLRFNASGFAFNGLTTTRYPTLLANVTDGSGGTSSTTISTISDPDTADAIATLAAQIQSIKDALAGTTGVNLVSIAS